MFRVSKKKRMCPDMSNLYDPKRYRYEIMKAVKKVMLNKTGNVYKKNSEGVTPINYIFNMKTVCRAMVKDLRNEEYYFKAAKLQTITVKNKERIVYHHPFMDKVIIAVLSNLMHEIFAKNLSNNSYAYQKGRGCMDAVDELSKYTHRHHHAGGLYLIKLDIQSYTDEVYVGEDSKIWSIIEELFMSEGIQPSAYMMKMIRFIIRPEYYNHDDHLMMNLYGIPTGSAITAILYNYYIYKLDHLVGALPDMLYVRYSDDILIAHHDKAIIDQAEVIISEQLHSNRLRSNKKKTERYFFSSSASLCKDQEYINTNVINYLGYRISAKGCFSLSVYRQRRFLRILQDQVKNSLKILKTRDKRTLKVLVKSINTSITDAVVSIPDIRSLVLHSTDFKQLRHMDYLIAMYIAEGYSGVKGPRAFRYIPYRLLRNRYRLNSLVQLAVRCKK
jgi:hypothetical protein